MTKLALMAFVVAVLALGCGGERPPASGVPTCTQDDVDVILDCGPRSDRITDEAGLDVVFCRSEPSAAGKECTFGEVHCMTRAYCESRCTDGSFVCE